MTKWDYKTEQIGTMAGSKKIEKILNIYGDDGYELVAVTSNGSRYIFKKPIEI